MDEPFKSSFAAMLRGHAASRDIHDTSAEIGFADGKGEASEAFIRRELERVDMHRRSLIPLLAKAAPARQILDFGCGTGGTTLALATATGLSAARVVGVDLNRTAIEAAKIRAASYRLKQPEVELLALDPGPLPFADGEFDLAVTVSVLEFITQTHERRAAVQELGRIVRPGGHLFISTPRPWVREYHSRRWLGDMRHRVGFPWSSSATQIGGWLLGWEAVPLNDELAELAAQRLGGLARISPLRTALPHVTRWYKLLFRRQRM